MDEISLVDLTKVLVHLEKGVDGGGEFIGQRRLGEGLDQESNLVLKKGEVWPSK